MPTEIPDPEPPAPTGPDPAPAPPEPSPTAGGRSGWAAIGVVGAALAVVLALTSFWGASGSDTNPAAAGGGTGTAAASDPTGSSGACRTTTDEPLDPTAAIRLLPNAPEPTYATDPPSSGAFVVGSVVSATPTEPLSRPVQVGLLAQGKVLVQYGPSLSPADVTDLEGLAGADIVVAPNPTLASPIVATAWRARQICDQLDLSALRQFATVNANRAPDAVASTTTTTG
jgi:hypothetical protein